MAHDDDSEDKQPEQIARLTDWTGEWDDAGAYWQTAFDSAEGVHPGLEELLRPTEYENPSFSAEWAKAVLEGE